MKHPPHIIFGYTLPHIPDIPLCSPVHDPLFFLSVCGRRSDLHLQRARGDVFTMDLSLPHRLGMNCVLVENEFQDGFKTPQVFVEYAKKHTIPVASDISRALG